MKRTIISAIVLVLFSLSLFTNVSAREYASINESRNEAYVISKNNFSVYFSGPVSEFALASQVMRSTLGRANTIVSEATVAGDHFSCNLEIPVASETVNLPIWGTLRSSFRSQSGMNSIIVEVNDKINGYTVRLFEIVNDTQEDTYLLYPCVDATRSVSGKPHLRIYIEDPDGMLFLIECYMPSSLQHLSACDYEQADMYKDAIFWALDLVDHETQIVPVSQEMLQDFDIANNSRALGSDSLWVPELTYYKKVTVGSTVSYCNSLPYLKMRHINLTNASDSTWTATFGVSEHVRVNGRAYYGMNVFSYTNLEMSFGCGDYSTFVRLYQEGCLLDRTAFFDELKEIGDDIAIDLLSYVVPYINVATTLNDVKQFVLNMQSRGENVYLGSNGVNLLSGYTAAVGERLPYLELSDCTDRPDATGVGHYFTLQAVLQGYNTSATTSTTGVLSVKFDVLCATEYYHHVEIDIPLEYTVYVLGG